MALTQGSVITASDFNDFKARVKAEFARRKYTGSLATYADTSYDVTATTGNTIATNDFTNSAVLLSKINPTTFTYTATKGSVITYLSDISSQLATLEAISVSSSSSGCSASCSGLCTTSCGNACTSCTSCSGCSGCSGCGSGCASSCSGNCGDACTGCTSCTSCTSCSGCSGCSGCGTVCSDGCSGCTGTCYASSSACSGCAGNCQGCTSCTGTSK